MPVHTLESVRREGSDDPNDPCGPYEALLYSDSGGLTQFGAFVEILPPGSASSLLHWHAEEDEMILVLDGTVALHEGDQVTDLLPGHAATFKAGVAVGHRLVNTSDSPARYLVMGTRAARETVTYPMHDCILHLDRETSTRRYTTRDGKPADKP
ncbi:MAG: cupin domain-containing protein [Pseudomonadota bacterium]